MRLAHSLTFALALATAANLHSQLRADDGDPNPTVAADLPASAATCSAGTVTCDGACPTCAPQDSHCLDPVGLRFFAEAGVNLVRPVQHGPMFVGSRPVANATGPAGIVTTKFRFPLQVGPRVMLGAVTENGYGVMMSWWGFEDGATTASVRNTPAAAGLNFASVPIPGIPGFTSPSPAGAASGVVNDAMTFTSRVRLQVWDGDWFFDSKCLGWNARTTIGARYAYLSQSYTALRVSATATDSDYLTSGHNFSGGGPTTAMIVRRPIFDTNIHLFFSDRLCVLFGAANQRSTQVSQLAGAMGGVTTTVSNASQTNTICMPTEDIEAGFEWARDFNSARAFVRTAVIDQTYFDAGNATSLHGNLTIIGMSIVGGITY